MKKKSVLITIGIVLAVVLIGWLCYLHFYNQMIKARFRVHALGRFMNAYKIVEGKEIFSLTDLPQVHLVSYSSSLELKTKDLKGRVLNGYYYDFKRNKDGKFVLSASPIHVFPFSKEFGMIEDGNVRVNRHQVDPQPDSYDEIKEWKVRPMWYDIKTMHESS